MFKLVPLALLALFSAAAAPALAGEYYYRVVGDGTTPGSNCVVRNSRGQKIGELPCGTVIRPHNVLRRVATVPIHHFQTGEVPPSALAPLTPEENLRAARAEAQEHQSRKERIKDATPRLRSSNLFGGGN